MKNKVLRKTAFHETFHAVQQQALVGRRLGLKSDIFTEDELNTLEHEFKDENYDDSLILGIPT